LKEYTVFRKFRDAEYTITILNPKGKQMADAPTFIPYQAENKHIMITL